jgi:hypothetical protein
LMYGTASIDRLVPMKCKNHHDVPLCSNMKKKRRRGRGRARREKLYTCETERGPLISASGWSPIGTRQPLRASGGMTATRR